MQQRGARARALRRDPCEGALARLRAICSKALYGRDLSLTDVRGATDDLVLINTQLVTSAWTAIGREYLSGIFALFSLALRLSGTNALLGISAAAREAHAALRTELAKQIGGTGGRAGGFIVAPDTPKEFKLMVIYGLLDTHAFRCYSALLSDAVTLLKQRRSQRNADAALEVCHEAAVAITIILNGSGSTGSETVAEKLEAELLVSGLLEHWAQAVLTLSSCEGMPPRLAELLARIGSIASVSCSSDVNISRIALRLLQDSPCLSYLLAVHTVRLAAALDGGPTYGMLTAVVAEAGMRGGASGTGLPPPLFSDGLFATLVDERGPPGRPVGSSLALWALSLWAAAITQARDQLHRDMRDGAVTAAAVCTGWGWRQERWRLQVRPVPPTAGAPGTAAAAAVPPPPEPLRRWVACATAPPLHSHAAFEVSLRLAAAAVKELERQLPQGQRQAAATAGPGLGSCRVQDMEAAPLAKLALECAQAACEDVAALPSVPGWVQQRLERYWRLLLAAAASSGASSGAAAGSFGALLLLPSADSLEDMLACLRVPDSAREALPPAPTPDVAAALSAGYLAAVERLLRRDSKGEGVNKALNDALGTWPYSGSAYELSAAAWAQMLAYGPRAAVFSLLASVAKRVRRALATGDAGADLFRSCAHAVRLLAVAVPLRWLSRSADAQELKLRQATAPDESPGAPSGASGGVAAAAASVGEDAGGGAGHEGAAAVGSSDGRTQRALAAAGAPAAVPDHWQPAAGGGASSCSQLRLALTFIATRVAPLLLRMLPRMAIHSPMACTSALPELLDWLPLLAAVARRRPDWGEQLSFARLAPPLLGAAVVVVHRSSDPDLQRSLGAYVRGALSATLQLAPEEPLAEALVRTDMVTRMCAEELPVPPASCDWSLRRLLGPGGAAPEPELLAALEGITAAAAAGRTVGDAAAVCGQAPGGKRPLEELGRWGAAAALLVPPAELAAAVPPLCANPGCTNLSGDSEAALRLPVECGSDSGGGCRLAYCSAQCGGVRAA